MARSVTTFMVCLLSAACAEETDPSARFTVEFASQELRDRADLVRAQVREGDCSGPAVFSTEISRGGATRAQPGKLARGVYGLWGAARDESCNWYAEGCRLFRVPVSGADLVVVLGATPSSRDPSCAADDDGGPGDAGSGGNGGPASGGTNEPDDAGGSGGEPVSDAGATGGMDAGGNSGTDGGTSTGGSSGATTGSATGTTGAADAGSTDAGGMDGSASGGDAGNSSGVDASQDAGPPAFDPRAPKCDAPTASVVACYDFENTLLDATTHHNDASGSARYETGVSGKALRVGGNTIRVPDAATLNVTAFTIELWVRFDSLLNLAREQGAPSVLLDKDQQYTVGILGDGNLFVQAFRGAGDSVTAYDTSTMDVGTFRYLAFTYDGERSAIYLDGTQLTNDALGLDLFRGNGGAMHLGSGSPSSTSPFDGLIDALRISRVSLSTSEICHNAGRKLSAGVCQ